MPFAPHRPAPIARGRRLVHWAAIVPLSIALAAWWGHRRAPAQDVEAIPDAPRFVGTGSCAAAACHGGRREPLGLKGSEYAFWAEFDPHRKGYEVLFGDRAVQIERNYRGLAAGEEPHPERNPTCLSCHVHAGFEARQVDREAATVADGVGCESCHGAAGRWLVPHTERGWRWLTAAEKGERFGMTATKDLATRARVCADCHVGTPAADVNHDMIAAGHPRLLFEFANQQAKHPRHWPIAADKARDPDYEARAWALGAAIGAERSLALLEGRARKADAPHGAGPWPELAEYDCFACHRGLRPGLLAGSKGEAAGTLPWSDWPLTALRRVASARRDADAFAGESALARLPDVMRRPGVAPAEAADLARLGRAELRPLEERMARIRFGGEEIGALTSGVLRDAEANPAPRWTDASRDYLALVALLRARGDLGGPPLDAATAARLSALRSILDLPESRLDGRIVDSPAAFDPARYRIDLRSLREGVHRPGE